MPLWFCVFVAVWATMSVLAAVVVGAFVMYCRETRANPLTQLRSGVFTPPEESSAAQKREEQPGFYD